MNRRRKKLVGLALAGVTLLIMTAVAVVLIRSPRETAAMRGYSLSIEYGCVACHGHGGTGGIPNPGSDVKTVPAWDGGTAMMYVENESEIREWILYGHTQRQSSSHDHDAAAKHDEGEDSERGSDLPIDMPAFKDVLSTKQVEALVAYFKAVARFEPLSPAALAGYRAANRLGCFGCHGAGGRVGAKNPRSFKGYIPPWHGEDYRELVKSDDELRAWILDGEIERFKSNALARFFTERQIIRMPAYRGEISDEDLSAIVAYITWLQERPSS